MSHDFVLQILLFLTCCHIGMGGGSLDKEPSYFVVLPLFAVLPRIVSVCIHIYLSKCDGIFFLIAFIIHDTVILTPEFIPSLVCSSICWSLSVKMSHERYFEVL